MEIKTIPYVMRMNIANYTGYYDKIATRIQEWWKMCEICDKCKHRKHERTMDKIPLCIGFNCCYMYVCKSHNFYNESDFILRSGNRCDIDRNDMVQELDLNT